MIELKLRYNQPDYNNVPTLHLYGVPPAATRSAIALISWRFEDDPTMPFEPLATTATGSTAVVPSFNNPDNRQIRLAVIGVTVDGEMSASDFSNAEQVVVTPAETPTLADLDFDGVNDENDLVVANNGGTGNINILRKIGSADFAVIDSVSAATTTHNDPVVLDGTYSYKLTQDGITGESNTLSVVVSGVGGSAGSPPSGLTATHDGTNTTSLDWINNAGTGSNVIERKLNAGSWEFLASTTSADTDYEDTTATAGSLNRTYYYRVRNESVEGYSNEAQVFVEGLGIP